MHSPRVVFHSFVHAVWSASRVRIPPSPCQEGIPTSSPLVAATRGWRAVGEDVVIGSAPEPELAGGLRRRLPCMSESGSVEELHPHAGDWLRDAVFGLNDGVVTTLVFILA